MFVTFNDKYCRKKSKHLMLAENAEKSRKMRFEEVDSVDFCWEISPESSYSVNNTHYGSFLRNVYHFDPSLHNLEKRSGDSNGVE